MSWLHRVKSLFGKEDGELAVAERSDGEADAPVDDAPPARAAEAERYADVQARYASLVQSNPYGAVYALWGHEKDSKLGRELAELRTTLAELAPSEEALRDWYRQAEQHLSDLEWG